MTENFTITTHYREQERDFEAVLKVWGYSYIIIVTVDGLEINFEPDEEKNFRAIVPPGTAHHSLPDTGLLQAIAQSLEKAFK